MLKVVFPTSQDIYIEVNGKKLAVVESYRAKSFRGSRYIEAFGESEPVGSIAGRVTHVIELSRIYSYTGSDGQSISFHDLTDFNLVIVKPDRKIIYSDCEWTNINEVANLNDTVAENVEIIAVKRMEVIA